MGKSIRIFIACGALIFLLCSCALPARQEQVPQLPPQERKEVARIQEKIVEGAMKFVRTQDLTVRGRTFNMDCTGLVLASYYYAGIDLEKDFGKYSGNGVERLYRIMENDNLLYKVTEPVIGDIIFWDNTYDRNGDGKYNDFFTHVGLVVTVTPAGEIGYAHCHYTKGVIVEYMNLHQPATYMRGTGSSAVVVNSPMRMKKDVWDDNHTLSGQLFRIFGQGYYLGLK